jgi:drug/metabolite transporter (DMT)-like permease
VTTRRPTGEGLGAALVVLAAFGFATLGPASRFAFEAGVDPLTLVTWRAVIGGLVVVVLAAVMARMGQVVARRWSDIPRRHKLMNVVAGLINAALNLTVLAAITRISIGLALLVFYTYPAMIAVVSTLFFGERLDRARWAALGVSLVGLILVLVGAGQVGELDPLGVGLAFLGALCQVAYALSARHGFPSIPAPQAAGGTFVVAAAAYLAASLVIGHLGELGQPLDSGAALAPVVFAGIIGAGIPTMAWIMGIRILGAPRAAIISTLEPVVGIVLAALLLAELPTPLQVMGGACIVVAAIVVQRRPGVEAAEHEAAEPSTAADPGERDPTAGTPQESDPDRPPDRTILRP